MYRDYIQRKKTKNNQRNRIYINLISNQKNIKSNNNNILESIKKNAKNQKELIQLNNNRYNARFTMSPKNNIKTNMIYKKNMILLKKEFMRKKNYSFDYKNTENLNKNINELDKNKYKKNKNILVKLNKNKKNAFLSHMKINSCENIKSNNIDNIPTRNKNEDKNLNIASNNQNKKNKIYLSPKQTKENTNNTYDKNNNFNINKNKTTKKVKNKINNEYYLKDTDENCNKIGTNLINNNHIKYNFNPISNVSLNININTNTNLKNNQSKKKTFFKNLNTNLDMPKFIEKSNKLNFKEPKKEEKEKFNEYDNDIDIDVKSSFYDEEDFAIINYDYTLNDKNRWIKVSKVDNFNFDGNYYKFNDFFKFVKKPIYMHEIKYGFNILRNIYKKKLEMDKTITDNGNESFILQGRIQQCNNIFNRAQQDIINNN